MDFNSLDLSEFCGAGDKATWCASANQLQPHGQVQEQLPTRIQPPTEVIMMMMMAMMVVMVMVKVIMQVVMVVIMVFKGTKTLKVNQARQVRGHQLPQEIRLFSTSV